MLASFIPRRRRGIGGSALALLAVGVGLAACGTNDGVAQSIALAGSDTTQDVMGAIADELNEDGSNPDPDLSYNILSVVTTPFNVPGDAHCASRDYVTGAVPPQVEAPNGSTAGRNALKASADAGDGCIDVARSSAGPRPVPTDPATFHYYAYALDAVGWTSASPLAPANLTQAQLQGIYNCTFTNWNQVGGGNGPIERYWPQAGSGTRAFAQSDLIGFDPTTFSGPACPAVQLTQENTGTVIAANGDQATAVVPYSVANWVAMSRDSIPDQRAGQVMKSLNGLLPVRLLSPDFYEPRTPTAADPQGPIAEANVRLVDPTPAYPGVRFVFNVLDERTPNWNQAKRLYGFDNIANPPIISSICNGNKASILQNFGFGPLDKTANGTTNIPGTACREYRPT